MLNFLAPSLSARLPMPASLPSSLPLGDLLDILPDAVVMVDAQGAIRYANPAVRALLGYAQDEIVGQPLALLIPRQLRERHQAMVEHFQREGAPMLMGARPVLHAVHRSGSLVAVSISLCNWTLDSGECMSVAVIHDVAELHTHLDRATALAETDPLTGVGNRLRLSRSVQALLMHERPFSLLLLDLRHFKQLNDRMGHAAGDRALQIVAHRLQSLVRPADQVVRLGGDEFVVLLDGLNDPQRLAERAQAVADAVHQPLRLPDGLVELGVNIGGAICPRHSCAEGPMLAAADRAMYAAKKADQTYRLADDI